ncbi:MAG: type II secretion system protein [Planctomycetes bacterium]|nr:type II secretion system protein [Planctomycetota bacterium]MBL7106588.1 type II secretion system protein [Phycisphaerae bacterium]
MKKNGFTLIEALISIVLVGFAIISLLSASTCYTNINGESLKLSNAEFLTEQIRQLITLADYQDPQTGDTTFGAEESLLSGYDDVDDYDAKTFSPPIDMNKSQISDLADYSQQITVENVSEQNLQQTVSDKGSNILRITVEINHKSQTLATTSWLRARY